MNKVILMGRLTRDPEVRYTQGENPMAIARYSLAVNRMTKQQEGQPSADFPNILAFGKMAEFAEKYLHKGTKIALVGRLQTGSYTNKDGVKVYTTEVVVESQEFAESKNTQGESGNAPHESQAADNGFMNIPDGLDEELPFN